MGAPEWPRLRDDLTALHRAALAAADPAAAVSRRLVLEGGTLRAAEHALPLAADARVWLVAFGKASPGMARAALERLGGRVAGGVISHPHRAEPGDDWPAAVRRFGAGHPIPDAGSIAAGAAVLDLLAGTRPDDLVLVLVSGGGSALLEALRPGVSLDDLQGLTAAMQHGGADIVELNTVRRALSRLKGGGLARLARPTRVVALLLSDVMGDRPEAIASGPTVPSPTGPAEALAALERRGLDALFPAVAGALRAAAAEPTPAEAGTAVHAIVGSNRLAAEALEAEARALGFRTLLLSEYLQGEAREAGRVVGGMARTVREIGSPLAPPACLLLGGETTVTVRGRGRGGRNQELALGAALALEGCPRSAVFSFATDGIEGPTDAAGAVVTGETIGRARALGLSPARTLEDNDCEPFFRTLGDLWVTGPSGTNVNDLTVALVYP